MPCGPSAFASSFITIVAPAFAAKHEAGAQINREHLIPGAVADTEHRIAFHSPRARRMDEDTERSHSSHRRCEQRGGSFACCKIGCDEMNIPAIVADGGR